MLSGRKAMAGDGEEEEEEREERGGEGGGGESSGRVGGVLRRRMGMHREMDDYARREQAGPWKLWHAVCVCCGGGLLMSARWGPVGVVVVVLGGTTTIKHQSTDTNGLLTPN